MAGLEDLKIPSSLAGIIAAVIGGMLLAAYGLGRHSAFQEMANTPPRVDTVYTRSDTVRSDAGRARIDSVKPKIRIHRKVVPSPRRDSTMIASIWHTAEVDTVKDGTHFKVVFASPEPIPPEAYFPEISFDRPDTVKVILTVKETEVKVVVDESIPWPIVVGTFIVGFILGLVTL